MAKERLDRLIASRSALSRGDVRRALRDGAVEVNGRVVRDGAFQTDADADGVALYGRPFQNARRVYIMLNKPRGVVSASADGRDRTVVDLVPPALFRNGLFPAGRLDRDTTGFVLITDDGDFAHRLLSPKSHVWKTYEAELARPASGDDVDAFARGVTLGDGTQCLSAELFRLEGNRAEIRIREGKYHQIKRMFAARGNDVLALRRTKIGGVALDPALPEGCCRALTGDEVEKMLACPEGGAEKDVKDG